MKPDVLAFTAWENGEMDEEDEAAFFQALVDNGLAWELQGAYGRRAVQLIESGAVSVDPADPTVPDEIHLAAAARR